MSEIRDVFVVEGVRTATGKFGGSLSGIPSPEVGAACIRDLVGRTGISDKEIDEVIFGIHFQQGIKANGARQAVMYAGLGDHIPAFTPNKNCGTGLKAIHLAAQSIQVGDNDVVVTGGAECMSNIPYLIPKARFGYKMGNAQLLDGMFYDGLVDPFMNYHMGVTAENLAKRHNISREEQDRFALECHRNAAKAWADGKFQDKITPIAVKGKQGEVQFVHDETYRTDITLESLQRLMPVFLQDGTGTVTPGNASPVNDGAAAILMMSGEKMHKLGYKPMARYVGCASAGLDPAYMGYGPVPAVKKLLAKTGLAVADIGLWELNEAFAVQALACIRDIGMDPSIVNVNGGAIALGHPVGMTGARISITLLQEMARRGVRYGVASLCIGGGQGIAMLFENCAL